MDLISYLEEIQNTNQVLSIQLNQGSNAALIVSPQQSQMQIFFLDGKLPQNFEINKTVLGIYWSGFSDDVIVIGNDNGDIELRNIYDFEKIIKKINITGISSFRVSSPMSPWGKFSLLVATEKSLSIITPFVPDNLTISKQHMIELQNASPESAILSQNMDCFIGEEDSYTITPGLEFITQESIFPLSHQFDSQVVDIEWDKNYLYSLLENNELFLLKITDEFPMFDSASCELHSEVIMCLSPPVPRTMISINENVYLSSQENLINLSKYTQNEEKILFNTYHINSILVGFIDHNHFLFYDLDMNVNHIIDISAMEMSEIELINKQKEQQPKTSKEEMVLVSNIDNLTQLRIEAHIKKEHLEKRIQELKKKGEQLEKIQKECENNFRNIIGNEIRPEIIEYIKKQICESYKILYRINAIQKPFLNEIANEKIRFELLKQKRQKQNHLLNKIEI